MAIYEHRYSKRQMINKSRSNPNAEYMGFEHINRYNDEHPDELHKEWMERHPITEPEEPEQSQIMRQTITNPEEPEPPLVITHKKVGRPPDGKTECSRCGHYGHNRRTCKAISNILGYVIKD